MCARVRGGSSAKWGGVLFARVTCDDERPRGVTQDLCGVSLGGELSNVTGGSKLFR